MNIGIFVTSITPKGVSQVRFQNAVFEGLRRLGTHRYHFYVLSHEVPAGIANDERFTYVKIVQDRRGAQTLRFLKVTLARLCLIGLRLAALGGSRWAQGLRKWMVTKPRYFQQLRELNLRLLWNMNTHELPTDLPNIRTIWDINHRIHPMFPEFSYSRFTFEGLDESLRASLAKASYIISGTEEGKRQLINIYGTHDRKVRVIPFPTPLLPTGDTSLPLSSGFTPPRPYVFYPARFWPHKNHVVIVNALASLKEKRGVEVDCVFCGPDQGNLDYVMRHAKACGVDARIHCVGEVSETDLAKLYANALALIYASAVGPDNLPPLEAMSLRCPAITADVPGAREQYGDACLFFPPTDSAMLADHILTVSGSASARDALIEKGVTRASSWTVDDYAKSVMSIIDEFAQIALAWDSGQPEFS